MSDELNNDLQQSDSSGNDGIAAEDIVGALSGDSGDGTLVVAEDRKPLNKSTIVTLVVLVLGVGSVWFMYQRTGPSQAAAASAKEAAEAKKTINNFLSGGGDNIKLMEQALRNTQKFVEQFLNYPAVRQIPLSELPTNPFKLNVDQPGDDGALSEAAEKKKREEERLAVLRAVQGLQLQSIMYGDARRACIVNGTLYTEGQTVENFTVEKINQASVIVKRGPYRFELRMQR